MMQELLWQRRSTPLDQLAEPAPAEHEIEALIQAGASVPDHGQLQPWRVIPIRGEQRRWLGEQLARAQQALTDDCPPALLDKQRNKPLRAPLVLIVIARLTPLAKIPEQEQLISAGLAAYQMQLAAEHMGYASVWLTGAVAYHNSMRTALQLEEQERLVAMLYLGTRQGERPARQPVEVARFLTPLSDPIR